MSALEILLARVVDYAGLFPPAALAMPDAVLAYAEHRAGAERWMLGRFVVPAARLGELASALPNGAGGGAPWPLAVLAAPDDADAIASFGERTRGARVESLELKAATPGAVAASRRTAERVGVAPRDAYVEIPSGDDPAPYADAARDAGVALKLRAGGVTSDAFPSAATVIAFMHACVSREVPFKLTAGLHHPLRGEHPLTYEAGSPCGTMHGFLNALAAASLLAAGHAPGEVAPVLEERDASALAFDAASAPGGAALRWRGLRAAAADLGAERRRLASFGSCSFAEPVADLRALGLLTAR